MRLWDSESGCELARFELDDEVTEVFADEQGNRAAAISGQTIRYWDLGRRDDGLTVYNPAPVDNVAMSPDGQSVVAGGQDGFIRRWDVDGRPLGRPLQISSAASGIWSVEFTRDGKKLISGGEDLVVRLWDLASGTAQEFPFGADIATARLAGNVWTIAVHPNKPIVAFGVAAGVYCVIAYTTTLRVREVGIRIALGARPLM